MKVSAFHWTSGYLAAIIIVVGTALVFGFIGLASYFSGQSSAPVKETPGTSAVSFFVDSIDGRKIPCVETMHGLSCDWGSGTSSPPAPER